MKVVKSWEVKGLELLTPVVRAVKILMGPDTHGVKNLSIGQVIIPSGSKSEAHAHEESEEYWIVVDGRGEAIVGEERAAIEPGMVIYAPPKLKHHIVNTGNEPLKIYFLFAPPGPEKALLKLMK